MNQGPKLCCKFAKTMIFNTNLDVVNDKVYTKFGLILSVHYQDIEQKLNYAGMTRENNRMTDRVDPVG